MYISILKAKDELRNDYQNSVLNCNLLSFLKNREKACDLFICKSKELAEVRVLILVICFISLLIAENFIKSYEVQLKTHGKTSLYQVTFQVEYPGAFFKNLIFFTRTLILL